MQPGFQSRISLIRVQNMTSWRKPLCSCVVNMAAVRHWERKQSDKANLIGTQWFVCLLLDTFLLFKVYQVPIKPILLFCKSNLHTTMWYEGGGGNWNKALHFVWSRWCLLYGRRSGGCVSWMVGRKASPPRGFETQTVYCYVHCRKVYARDVQAYY